MYVKIPNLLNPLEHCMWAERGKQNRFSRKILGVLDIYNISTNVKFSLLQRKISTIDIYRQLCWRYIYQNQQNFHQRPWDFVHKLWNQKPSIKFVHQVINYEKLSPDLFLHSSSTYGTKKNPYLQIYPRKYKIKIIWGIIYWVKTLLYKGKNSRKSWKLNILKPTSKSSE